MLLKRVFRTLQSLLDLRVVMRVEFLELIACGRIDRRNRHAFTLYRIRRLARLRRLI